MRDLPSIILALFLLKPVSYDMVVPFARALCYVGSDVYSRFHSMIALKGHCLPGAPIALWRLTYEHDLSSLPEALTSSSKLF